jgi:glycosyltransferase involved in cell wall biosynthesis
MNNLKISIITPSYNQGHFIEETILSVLNQGYDNLEYIIIDGGSTDNTVDIIKKYENQLAYWVSEKDNGQTDAINKGFKMATGDIIAWLNSDDVYCDGAFENISEYFHNNPQCEWLAGSILFMNNDGQVYVRKYPNTSRWLEKNVMLNTFQPNVFLRRSVLTTIGYPREDYHMTMDYEWFYRIAQQFPLHVINKDIAKFRWHVDSKSSSQPNSRNQQLYHAETIQIIQKYHPKLTWLTNKYPKVVLPIWFRFVKLMRFLERIRKGELRKLSDKIA